MTKRRMLLAVLCLLAGWGGAGMAHAETFIDVTDEAGRWFDTGADVAGTRSLAIVAPGETITFLQQSSKFKFGPTPTDGPSRVESRHTVTSLIWPSGASGPGAPAGQQIDQPTANLDNQSVTLTTPGLHVFVCKVHPYMLGAVIVDTDGLLPLDIGQKLHLLGTTNGAIAATAFPSDSDLALRLLRTFFVVTNPANWKDYTKIGQLYDPTYPSVTVKVGAAQAVVNLDDTLKAYFGPPARITGAQKPDILGVGEVWVDTQYEETASKGKAYPSTITVVDVGKNWKVTKKIALPVQKMNNGHNMWASHDQQHIYQTEWHGKSLFVINRLTGAFENEIVVGEDPAHVMTRVNNEQVHVTLNGEDAVVELNALPTFPYVEINHPARPQGRILMQYAGDPQAQPHAHWMGHDGNTMATPNSNSANTTLFDFSQNQIRFKTQTGALPIAAAMNPTSTKYYVSNYLGNSTSVIDMASGAEIAHINLLQNYNAITGVITGPVGALPIQTPVSPDGKFVITGNTLTGTITIIDAQTDTLVAMVPCDPGCHGVNFGAKKGGGYYAYVTSKFSNRLIILDYDPNNNGILFDGGEQPTIAGWVVLVANNNTQTDDAITGNRGMGGQGVLPVPNVYNGWVQKLPQYWKDLLTATQLNPAP